MTPIMAPILTHRLWYSMAEASDAAVLGNLPDGTLRLIAWLLGLLGSRRRPRTLSATDLAVVNQSLEGCLGKYCNLLMNNRPLLCKFLIIFVPWIWFQTTTRLVLGFAAFQSCLNPGLLKIHGRSTRIQFRIILFAALLYHCHVSLHSVTLPLA